MPETTIVMPSILGLSVINNYALKSDRCFKKTATNNPDVGFINQI
jgi:hypothetical protein